MVFGAFSDTKEFKGSGDESSLDLHGALQFARYAALLNTPEPGKVEFFDPTTAGRIVNQTRNSTGAKTAFLDYLELEKLGVSEGFFHNQGALAAYDSQEYESAIKAINDAVRLRPEESVFLANKGYLLFTADLKVEAYEALSAASQLAAFQGQAWQFPSHFLSAFALSAAASMRVGQVEVSVARELLERALQSEERTAIRAELEIELDLIEGQ